MAEAGFELVSCIFEQAMRVDSVGAVQAESTKGHADNFFIT